MRIHTAVVALWGLLLSLMVFIRPSSAFGPSSFSTFLFPPRARTSTSHRTTTNRDAAFLRSSISRKALLLWSKKKQAGGEDHQNKHEQEHHELLPEYAPKSHQAALLSPLDQYHAEYQRSITDPETFWRKKALQYLDWERPFDAVLQGSFENADITWFQGGKLNVCYNAVDRHVLAGRGDKIAMIWEGDEPDMVRQVTFRELQTLVCKIANALTAQGVRKGDVVTIYMPMMVELPATMLACARIGAAHSVVFAGFSADALSQRVTAASSSTLVTAVTGHRGGKTIDLKGIVDTARTIGTTEETLQRVLVWERRDDDDNDDNNTEITIDTDEENPSFEMQPKDVRLDSLVRRQRPYCPVTPMNAEDILFILYTSGSTGQPKGVVHTTGGYALYAAFTTHTTFALQSSSCTAAAADEAPNKDNNSEVFACVADCGWITGHTYVVYGPLLNGVTTFLFESTPLYPDPGRYWDMVQRHGITHFYTAPTAIRSLMRYGNDYPAKYDLGSSSLKILGSVGEPINPEAWRWYYEVVGRSQCTVVDTYWQTETGGHVITNIPGVTPMKPGSCTLPMYGIDVAVLDPVDGHEITEPNNEDKTAIEGVVAIRQPWPGMARTCLGDHERFETVYLKPYPGYYFCGDSVMRDRDGYFFITGRVDDVLNVSGHRIGTAEIESALVAHPAVSQAAVVGKAHPIKGEAIVGFVTLDVEHEESDELIIELRNQVRKEIGPFASPDKLWVSNSLPMTRSGKIMRRILRKIVAGEVDSIGDTSTLADPTVVDTLIEKVAASSKKQKTH